MHPTYGVPLLHHDQLNVIAQHLSAIKEDINHERYVNENDDIVPTITKLTRKSLKSTDEWPLWNKAEFLQLDQYEQQDTFGPPCRLPPGANVLNLLWTYTYKAHENRYKARCVCNGYPNCRGTLWWKHTLALLIKPALVYSGLPPP